MIHFQCDYTNGIHPKIIQKMNDINKNQYVGYGEDQICKSAADKIKQACNKPNADVHFLVGGTQANTIVISSILKPYQGVISADSGHIAVHEAGAIEASGHKVLIIPSTDGKIAASQIDDLCITYSIDPVQCHTVEPSMVYISFPTETGMIYNKSELQSIKEACDKWQIPLFIDGARLGYGLAGKDCDVKLADIAEFCDVFYIGGTKCGALFGEAVVIINDKFKKGFRHIMKQRGGLLAKGWMLGIQFDTLFSDNLYLEICKNAVNYALRIKDALRIKGIEIMADSQTNQQFFAISDEWLEILSKKYVFQFIFKMKDGRNFIRICTSWSSKEDDVNSLIDDILAL